MTPARPLSVAVKPPSLAPYASFLAGFASGARADVTGPTLEESPTGGTAGKAGGLWTVADRAVGNASVVQVLTASRVVAPGALAVARPEGLALSFHLTVAKKSGPSCDVALEVLRFAARRDFAVKVYE
ncbi:hypothetical protein ACQKGO_34765 [Corallococcus interemptor]|uniref:hypothetical protein n=1 Tax=Corallococcus interemptor TaxID=2316720 RepID=UPI003D05A641